LCKPCYMERYHKEWSRRPEVKAKKRSRSWATYGMDFSVADYEALFDAQGRVCAICERLPGGLNLRVDHDHRTGAVRGLLCDYCNRRLMVIRNTIRIFSRAVAYLERATPAAQ
jgi:hypothetical protein